MKTLGLSMIFVFQIRRRKKKRVEGRGGKKKREKGGERGR
jgi:hypothetical protein